MNRQARRQAERAGQKTPQVISRITTDEYKKTLEEIQFKATREAVRVMTATMAMALNNEYGFGTKRVQRTIDRMRLQFECISSNTLSTEDLLDWCESKNIQLI